MNLKLIVILGIVIYDFVVRFDKCFVSSIAIIVNHSNPCQFNASCSVTHFTVKSKASFFAFILHRHCLDETSGINIICDMVRIDGASKG